MIKDEVTCIKDYLSILNIRYQDKFSVCLKVNEAIYECKTIKMILQPIVENAIYHGIERKKCKGLLIIQGDIIDNRNIQFIISDNGKGMNPQELGDLLRRINSYNEDSNSQIKDKRGIGLININKRVKLFFGNEYGINVYSCENEGTQVWLKMPVIEK